MSQYFAQWRDGYQVIWRNLTWSEYRSFKSRYDESPFLHPMDIALDIYNLVSLKGPAATVVPSGIVAYICKQQMQSNPFSGQYQDIAMAITMARRVVQGDFLLSAKAMIASILHYRIEEIDNWDPTTFFVRLAQAELVSGRTFEPLDPRAAKGPDGQPVPPKNNPQMTPMQRKALERVKDRKRQDTNVR